MCDRISWIDNGFVRTIREYAKYRAGLFDGQAGRLLCLSFTAGLLAGGILIIANYAGIKPAGTEMIYKYRLWADLHVGALTIRDFGGDIYVYDGLDRHMSSAYSRRLDYANKILAQVLTACVSVGLLVSQICFWVPGVYSVFMAAVKRIDNISRSMLRPLDNPVPDVFELHMPRFAMFAVHDLHFKNSSVSERTKPSPVSVAVANRTEQVVEDISPVSVQEPLDPEVLLQQYLSKVFQD